MVLPWSLSDSKSPQVSRGLTVTQTPLEKPSAYAVVKNSQKIIIIIITIIIYSFKVFHISVSW